MFSLHLYKNTEYSRVFTQTGNSYICFLAPRRISCLEPFHSSTELGRIWIAWARKRCPGWSSVQPQTTQQPTGEQYLRAVVSLTARFLTSVRTMHRLMEALTKTGKWETMFFSFFFLVDFCIFSSQLRPVAALNIHRLCIYIFIYICVFCSFVWFWLS